MAVDYVKRQVEETSTYSVGSCAPQTSIPPLACGQIRAVNLKLPGRRIPLGHRLEATHIATMTQFTLSIAAYDVVAEYLGHPELLLGVGTLLSYRGYCMGQSRQSSGFTPWWHLDIIARKSSLPNMVMWRWKGLISSLRYSAIL